LRRSPSPRPMPWRRRPRSRDADAGADGLLDSRTHSHEDANPLNRWLAALYQPAIDFTLGAAARLAARARVGHAGLAALALRRRIHADDGRGRSALYADGAARPVGGKGVRTAAADRPLIRTVPEVESVFGKAGRAETATDPAPLEMFETTIRLRPRSEWRPGMTPERIIEELDRVVRVPGLTNVWVPPIRNRIDMLATGVKSPIGVKVSGPDLATIDAAARASNRRGAACRAFPPPRRAHRRRTLSQCRYRSLRGGRLRPQRRRRAGVVSGAIGGENIGEVVDGRARYPINLRYPREVRDTLERLIALPIVTDSKGLRLTLGEVARVASPMALP
jgi:Cu(I)/Ag(I) efflux system membrane protein CusA/SilA